MAFQRFSRDAARTDTGAKWVSIQSNGSISVSYAALKEIGLPERVFLLYDLENHRIAVEAAPEDSKDSYPARLQGRGDNPRGARVVSASAFFKHIGLDPAKAQGRYDAKIEDSMVVVSMKREAFKQEQVVINE